MRTSILIISCVMVCAAGCSSKQSDDKTADTSGPAAPDTAEPGASAQPAAPPAATVDSAPAAPDAPDTPPATPPAATDDAPAKDSPRPDPATAKDEPAAKDKPKDKPQDKGKRPNTGKPEDLRVLPKKWSRERVTKYMEDQIERGLGVKCDYCHDEDDYAADHEHKELARKMIAMTDALNREFFAGKPKVSCYSCHNGNEEPK